MLKKIFLVMLFFVSCLSITLFSLSSVADAEADRYSNVVLNGIVTDHIEILGEYYKTTMNAK